MHKHTLVAAALCAAAGTAQAGGLDRSGQPISAIFAGDNSIAFSLGYVTPSVTGTDLGGTGSYDVGEGYSQFSFSYTNEVTDAFSYALLVEQPYGTNVNYNGNPLTDNLAGTNADLSSRAASVILRYKIGDRFSVHGGVSYESVKADVALNGVAYRNAITAAAVTRSFNASRPAGTPALSSRTLAAALGGNARAAARIGRNYGAGALPGVLAPAFAAQSARFVGNGGYAFNMQEDSTFNYLLGATYEIPDIALRFSATYRFETDHSASTTEAVFGSVVPGNISYKTPQSLNLDFQTGISQSTLLTASFRWTDFSEVDVIPLLLQSDLVNLDDSHRYTVGLAHRFNESLAGSVTFIYEPENNRSTVSPLGPTDGLFGITVGGQYRNDDLTFSGGINYSWLGDAVAGVAGQPVASFTDNSALGVGVKAEFTF